MTQFHATKNRGEGFTLLEAAVVIFVFIMLSYGITALVSSILTNSQKQETSLYNADQARKVSFQVMNELRNSVTANTGSYALNTAQDQQIIFYSNIDGGLEVERVRYFINNGQLSKGVTKPTGSPLSYNLANEDVRTVQGDVANGAQPLFYYYDGNFNGTVDSFLAQPVDVTDVKYIRMNLRIYNKGGTGVGIYDVTAASTIRNLKNNLGD
jgi:type II secretory pathway component PulJ